MNNCLNNELININIVELLGVLEIERPQKSMYKKIHKYRKDDFKAKERKVMIYIQIIHPEFRKQRNCQLFTKEMKDAQ